MSKTGRRSVVAVALALVGCVGVTWAMHERNAAPGVAVVELFTSEGCSSCPPADALVRKLVKERRERVFPLAFHVDYWDTPQWRDAFSDVRFSRRQEGYAKRGDARDVYTPQMVVNGGKGFVGSDEEVLREQIAAGLGQKAAVSVDLVVTRSGNQVAVQCTIGPSGVGKVLNVALVERGIRRQIKGGENARLELAHENVVRAFESAKIAGPKSDVGLTLPADAVAGQCSVIAYVQDDAMRVMGAAGADLERAH